jgi:Methyltransferase domain
MPIVNPINQWLDHHWSLRNQNINRDHVLRVLSDAEYSGLAVEVGTFKAEFAERILQRTAIKTLYCIDPYASYDQYQDRMNHLDLQKVFEIAQQRLTPYGSRARFVRETSDNTSHYWLDSSLDFAYIDGNHSYSFVLSDLNLWWPKVKQGGMIVGDDAFDQLNDPTRNAAGDVPIVWDSSRPNDLSMYGVAKAFVDFAQSKAAQVQFYDNQVFLIKTTC